MKIETILFKKLRDNLTAKEEAFFQSWLKDSKSNTALYNHLIQLKNEGKGIHKLSKLNVDKAWGEIQEKLKSLKKDKLIPFYSKIWFKYTAAASIVLLVSLGVHIYNKDNQVNVEAPVVVQPHIEAGTDKATLTLEDGSTIALEKGNTFQIQDANSNGEKITYTGADKPSKNIEYHYLTIPRGGQFHITLSDGTEVWLNSESQLKYPRSFIKGETRMVELVYGEAYFDVSPSSNHNGAKFKVLNNAQEVEVLGTEFNIKAYKDEVNAYTTLIEGKVTVNNGVSKQNLVPEQQYKLHTQTNTFTVAKVNVQQEVSWKNGTFSFKDKPLVEIMKVISRWYDVDVVFENEMLKSVEFIGTLDKKQSIEEILSIIKSASINDYTIDSKNKIVTLK